MKRCSVRVIDNVSGRTFLVDCYGVSPEEMMTVQPSNQLRQRLAARGLTNTTSSPFWVEELPARYPVENYFAPEPK